MAKLQNHGHDMGSALETHLPIVIPILFYHGKSAWNLPASFQIMFNDYGNLSTTLQEMIPNFHYLCDDFSDPVRRKAKGDLLFEIFLMVQDFVYITDPEENHQMLREIFKRVHMIQTIDRFKKHLEMFFNYMVHAKDNLQAEEFLKTLESMEPERSGIMPTIQNN